MENINKILKGHTSQNTAYIVNDYPYGFRLRCKIRYWLEYNKKHGLRFCSQTTNPKKIAEIWNKPKYSTYFLISACMYLDENNHVQWTGLSEYSGYEESKAFAEKYIEGVPGEAKKRLENWIETKRVYEEKIKNGIDWKQAGRETAIEMHKRGITIH